MPLLCGNEQIQSIDQRPAPTLWDGIVTTVIQNAEPIKLAIYALILAIPIYTYRDLYLSAERSRNEAIAQRDANLRTLEWAVNETALIPYDRAALSETNPGIALIRGLITRLRASSFAGVIKVIGHMGQFCYRRNPHSGALETPARTQDCTEGGTTRDYALALAQRQSETIRRLLLLAERPGDKFEIATVSYGTERPKYCYPAENDAVSASDWNAIAQLNNRIQIELVPAASREAAPHTQDAACIAYTH